MNSDQLKYFIKSQALNLGFSFTGFSKAGFLRDEAYHLEAWLNKGMHGKMGYMENHFDLRLDPSKLFPGAETVISFVFNYFPEKIQDPQSFKVAKYAYGKDYHQVLKTRLQELIEIIIEAGYPAQFKICVDSVPILEKAWAKKSGAGWVGKNGNLIRKSEGSFFFLAEIITDIPIQPDGPVKDHCGSCTLCLEACPTEAIVSPGVVDGSKCISYFTIELKDQIPGQFKNTYNDWIFGCDICQDVCPWNRFSKPNPNMELNEGMIKLRREDWEDMTEEIYKALFKGSPLKRAKYMGLMRNIDFLKQEQGIKLQ